MSDKKVSKFIGKRSVIGVEIGVNGSPIVQFCIKMIYYSGDCG